MKDSQFPVPHKQHLPGDPAHGSGARLPLKELEVELVSVQNSRLLKLDLICLVKTDVLSLEEKCTTRRFLLSREGANALVSEMQRALDQG